MNQAKHQFDRLTLDMKNRRKQLEEQNPDKKKKEEAGPVDASKAEKFKSMVYIPWKYILG